MDKCLYRMAASTFFTSSGYVTLSVLSNSYFGGGSSCVKYSLNVHKEHLLKDVTTRMYLYDFFFCVVRLFMTVWC